MARPRTVHRWRSDHDCRYSGRLRDRAAQDCRNGSVPGTSQAGGLGREGPVHDDALLPRSPSGLLQVY